MTLEDRVFRLESAFIHVADVLSEQTDVLREHGQLLRNIAEQLERIERAIRERGTNGRQP